MIDLATLVLDASGRHLAPIGTWLKPIEGPFWVTRDEDGDPARIEGAAPYDAQTLKTVALEIRVKGRELAPLIGASTTRVRVVEANDPDAEWQELRELRPGDLLRVPEKSPFGLMVAWRPVVAVRRAEHPPRLWPGTPYLWGTLRLETGRLGFPTPSAFVRVP